MFSVKRDSLLKWVSWDIKCSGNLKLVGQFGFYQVNTKSLERSKTEILNKISAFLTLLSSWLNWINGNFLIYFSQGTFIISILDIFDCLLRTLKPTE